MGIAMLMAPQVWKIRGQRMSQCDQGEALTFKTGGKAEVRQEVFPIKAKAWGLHPGGQGTGLMGFELASHAMVALVCRSVPRAFCRREWKQR